MLRQIFNLLQKTSRKPATRNRRRTTFRRALFAEALEGRRLLTLFAPLSAYPSGSSTPYNLETADFDNDGDLDIAVANISQGLGVLINNGSGVFTTTNYATVTNVYNVAAGDFDEDGDQDVALTTFGNLQIMRNNGSGVFTLHTQVPTGSVQGYNLDTGDFNEDGHLDLAVGRVGLGIFFGNGTGSFSAGPTFPTSSFIHDTVVGDLNNDGHDDIVQSNVNGDSATVVLGNGNGTFQPFVDYPLGGNNDTRHVALGDLNNDGNLDIVSANRTTNAVGVILGNGFGGFGAPTTFSLLGGPLDGSLPYGVQVADFNRDGNQDVVTANRNSTGTVSILLGNGTGNLTVAEIIKGSGSNTKDVVVGDFNNDGRVDVAEQSISSNTVGVLLNISNLPPIANAGGPYTVNEGGTIPLTGSGSDPDGDPITFEWDLDGDNIFGEVGGARGNETLQNPTFSAAGLDGPSTFTVRLRTRDSNNAVSLVDTATITVNNSVPSFASPPADQSSDEGETKNFDLGSFSDAGADAPWSVTVAWGDGTVDTFTTSSPGSLGNRPHTYGDDGTYTVTVTVEDDDDSGSTTFNVDVSNLDPTIDPIDDGSSLEGLAFSFTAAFSDPEFDISGGISSFIRMAGIGANFGNREFDKVFTSGDRPGSINRITEAAFNALTPAQLRASYDVLLFTWASQTSLNGDWNTRIKPFLDLGGSVFWEDDSNVGDLAPGVVGSGFNGSYGSSYQLTPIPGLTDGISGNFVNHHLQVASWLPEFTPFIFGPGGTPTLGLAGVFPSGGRMIVTGPDMDFHAVRGGSGASGNQYQFILNQVDWLVTRSEFQATIDWGDGHVESGTVTSTNGGVGVPTPGTINGDHVYADNGIYTVTVTVDDEEGGTDVATFKVTVGNQDPVLIASADLTEIDEGGSINILASFTDPGFDNPLNTGDPLNGGEVEESFDYVIDWGDGTTDTVGLLPGIDGQPTSGAFSAGHIYADNGNYTITVTVNDDDTGSDFVEISVIVNNMDPVANASANQTVDEGDLVTLTGSFTDVGLDDGHKQEWTVVASNGELISPQTTDNLAGDSDGSGGSSFSFTPGDNGTYTVTYTVTDDDGGVHSDVSVITVNNVEPTLTGLSATPILENGTTTLSGIIADDGTLDTFTVEIDWDGDGSYDEAHTGVAAGLFSYTHQYLDDNPTGTDVDNMPINVRVTDDDAGDVTGSTTVEVTNVVPVITEITSGAEECGTAHEDDPITLDLSFDDAGSLDVHTVVVDWGDASVETIVLPTGDRALSVNHDYATGGIYTIMVTLTDDDTGEVSTSLLAVVSGVGLQNGVLQIIGTSGNDHVTLNQTGNGLLKVHADFIAEYLVGGTRNFLLSDIDSILAYLCDGDDHMTIASQVAIPAIVHGDAGNDHLNSGGGPTVLLGGNGNDMLVGGSGLTIQIGGLGLDRLVGGRKDDVLIGGSTNIDHDDDALMAALTVWNGPSNYATRVDAIDDLWSVYDDEEEDKLTGSSGLDLFYSGLGDVLTDVKNNERVLL